MEHVLDGRTQPELAEHKAAEPTLPVLELPTEAAWSQAAGLQHNGCPGFCGSASNTVLHTARHLAVALLATGSHGSAASVEKSVAAIAGPFGDGTGWPTTGTPSAVSGPPTSQSLRDQTLLMHSVLFDAHVRAGSTRLAAALHAQLQSAAHESSTASMIAQRVDLVFSHSELSSQSTEVIRKISRLETSSINERLDLLERARCSLAIGQAWRLLGERVNASAWLATCALLFQRAGQHDWVVHTQNESSLLALTTTQPPPALRTAGGRGQSAVLSEREREMARLIRLGHTNREIADALHVSVKTVEATLSGTYRRLGIRGRQQLAVAIPA